jgi:hypothetical protein
MTKKQLAAVAKRWARDAFKTRHSLEVCYAGYDHDLDRAIEKAAGVSREGSGMSMLTGLRDVRFDFKTERSARAAVRRVKKVARGLRFMLHSSKKV